MEPGPNRNMSPIHSVESFDNKILCSNLSHSYYWIQNNPGEYAHYSINNFADFNNNNANGNYLLACSLTRIFTLQLIDRVQKLWDDV